MTTRTDGNGRAVVEVRDSGMGIPLEIRERIFDPFFTTKPASEGTGLGLWICSGILSALGGEVRVESEIGRGSTFRVTLPPAVMEMWTMPAQVFSTKALSAYVFAGIVPGLLAYAGFAWLGGKFGSVRTSLVLYIGPIASALLSFVILGEPPKPIHFLGGLLILGGVWASLRR